MSPGWPPLPRSCPCMPSSSAAGALSMRGTRPMREAYGVPLSIREDLRACFPQESSGDASDNSSRNHARRSSPFPDGRVAVHSPPWSGRWRHARRICSCRTAPSGMNRESPGKNPSNRGSSPARPPHWWRGDLTWTTSHRSACLIRGSSPATMSWTTKPSAMVPPHGGIRTARMIPAPIHTSWLPAALFRKRTCRSCWRHMRPTFRRPPASTPPLHGTWS